jgi:RNA polymerase sigma factor (sigma-70 family)
VMRQPEHILECWIDNALDSQIPKRAVFIKCRNFGFSVTRAVEFAEECSAVAFQRCLEHSFSDYIHFNKWLVRAAVNYLIDVLRRERRNMPFGDLVKSVVQPENRIEAVSQQLHFAIRQLNKVERIVIESFYLDGLSLLEISSLLNSTSEKESENATRLRVKRIKDRALLALQKLLIDL